MQAATASLVSTPPATGRLFVRFFWKECRRLRGMAIGVAVLAALLMLFIKAVTPPAVWPDTFFVMAFGGAAMLAIAAAVTLFSVEREEGTADVLRVLPTNRPALLAGKVAAAVAVVIAATVVLCSVAYVLGSEGGNQIELSRYAPQGSLVVFEALAWGLLASLVCPNPLVAAVLGIAATSASSQIAMALANTHSHGYTLRDFESATTARLALAGVALLIDGWLGLRWPGDTAKAPTSRPRSRALSNWFARLPKPRLGAFTRLVWQSVRQSWLTIAAVVALGVFLTASFALITSFFTNDGVVPWFVPSFGLLFAPALVGSVVFRADQRGRRYRFLSEHAAKPRTLWLARQATWLAPLVLVGGVAMLLAWRFGAGAYFDGALDRAWDLYWSPDGVDAATLRGRLVDDTLAYPLRVVHCGDGLVGRVRLPTLSVRRSRCSCEATSSPGCWRCCVRSCCPRGSPSSSCGGCRRSGAWPHSVSARCWRRGCVSATGSSSDTPCGGGRRRLLRSSRPSPWSAG